MFSGEIIPFSAVFFHLAALLKRKLGVFHVKPRGFARCGFTVPRRAVSGFFGWVLVLLEPHGHNEILRGFVAW